MASVTARISQVSQPRGGYIKPTEFKETYLFDGKTLGEENVHPSIVGMAVDYLTRYMIAKNHGQDNEKCVKLAFNISIMGYLRRIKLLGDKVKFQDEKDKVDIAYLLRLITGLDDKSIYAACMMSAYDVWFRNPAAAMMAGPTSHTDPDKQTINNIRIMVERSLCFWDKYGPVVKDGFSFEEDGYTSVVDSGDGDYLTSDTMWDFKVSKSKPTNKHTLQLLMYWIMGKHSKRIEFKNIDKLGIYNPRLNVVYIFDTHNLSTETIETIEREVICY